MEIASQSQSIHQALQNLYQQIAAKPIPDMDAASRLIAVSKRQPIEKLEAALEAGHRVFGENILQEVEDKWPDLRKRYPDVQLHYIGHIQSRKLASIVQHCDVIHSIDRPKLIEKLATLKTSRALPGILFQVNIGREAQKSGCLPEELPALLALCEEHEITVKGLMCIPPAEEDPTDYFKEMKQLQEKYALRWLSMGMSGDYEIAMQEGATHIRVGTGLFGSRVS